MRIKCHGHDLGGHARPSYDRHGRVSPCLGHGPYGYPDGHVFLINGNHLFLMLIITMLGVITVTMTVMPRLRFLRDRLDILAGVIFEEVLIRFKLERHVLCVEGILARF